MAVFFAAHAAIEADSCAYDACGTAAEAWRAARYTSYKAQNCVRRCDPLPPSPPLPLPPPPRTEWTHDTCVAATSISVDGAPRSVHIVRNAGGGTSRCCRHWPVAAPARVDSDGAVELMLEPRPAGRSNRNGARVYLADACTEGGYSPSMYASFALLGKTLAFTVDLSTSFCGCNVAFYLAAMPGNTAPGNCGGDFYCDANQVCGVHCAEIDLMEANVHAFKAVAHTSHDGDGVGNGLGGGSRAFSSTEYGPGASKIDTRRPFRVHTSFAEGRMGTTLEQEGRTIGPFAMAPPSYVRRLAAAFASGFAIVASYWSSDDMWWLSRGPCVVEDQDRCGTTVRFSDIALCAGDVLCP